MPNWMVTGRAGGASGGRQYKELRVILGYSPLTIENDVLKHHFRLTCPAGMHLELSATLITAKIVPTGTPAKFDIKVSNDGAVTWTTIYTSDIELDVLAQFQDYDVTRFATASFISGTLFRCDVTDIGNEVAGGYIEILLIGAFVPD